MVMAEKGDETEDKDKVVSDASLGEVFESTDEDEDELDLGPAADEYEE